MSICDKVHCQALNRKLILPPRRTLEFTVPRLSAGNVKEEKPRQDSPCLVQVLEKKKNDKIALLVTDLQCANSTPFQNPPLVGSIIL